MKTNNIINNKVVFFALVELNLREYKKDFILKITSDLYLKVHKFLQDIDNGDPWYVNVDDEKVGYYEINFENNHYFYNNDYDEEESENE